MTNYFVYQHRRGDTNDVFYVGKGKLARGKPYRATARVNRNPHWQNIVNLHGFKAEVLVDGIDEEFAFLIERETIDIYRRRGYSLVNYTDGGEGTSGRIVSEETRRKISEGNKGKIQPPHTEEAKKKIGDAGRGRKHTDETKAIMSAASKGKPKSEEHRRKLSEYLTGRPQTEASKENLRKKKWVTDGVKDYFITPIDGKPPEGMRFGRVTNRKYQLS